MPRLSAGSQLAAMTLVAALGIPTGLGAQEPDPVDVAAIHWVELLKAAQFDSAASLVAPSLQDRLGSAQLQELWSQLSAQFGELQELAPGSRSQSSGYEIADLAATFANGAYTVRVVLDDDMKVGGFFIRPPEGGGGAEIPEWTAPAYADPNAFVESDVKVGRDPWLLDGTLTLPVGEGPVPGIVLVHGSGPQDRDETIGPNKVFRDLAGGLASEGIAVLRYEKRTHAYGSRMAAEGEVNLDAEVIQDALSGVDVLRAHREVNPRAIFVLGHSLGGTMAPEIARRDHRLAGIVIMAGSARPFTEIVRAQFDYLRGLPENGSAQAQQQIDDILATLDRYDAGQLDDTASIMGAPVSYVRELEARDPVGTLAAIDTPALLLQGGRDYQVTLGEDFQLWQNGLKGRANTTFLSYPSLSHLFTPGEGMATPTEYATERKHVSGKVIHDIADWIRQTAG